MSLQRAATMLKEDIRQRAETAREHLQVAEERLLYAESVMEASAAAQVSAANAVSAGIAAADAICGARLGIRSNSRDHREAAKMLEPLLPDGHALAARFLRLASDKTLFQYGGWSTAARARAAVGQARHLVDAMTSHGVPTS